MPFKICTWHFALFSSNRVKAWKFFAGMLGAFLRHINALQRDRSSSEIGKRLKLKKTHIIVLYKSSYFVLQGFPTTITFALRDATELSAFPCKASYRTNDHHNAYENTNYFALIPKLKHLFSKYLSIYV